MEEGILKQNQPRVVGFTQKYFSDAEGGRIVHAQVLSLGREEVAEVPCHVNSENGYFAHLLVIPCSCCRRSGLSPGPVTEGFEQISRLGVHASIRHSGARHGLCVSKSFYTFSRAHLVFLSRFGFFGASVSSVGAFPLLSDCSFLGSLELFSMDDC